MRVALRGLSAIPINAPFRAVVSVDDASKNPCLLGLPFRPVLPRYAEFIYHVASLFAVKSSRDVCGCGQVWTEILAHMGFRRTFLVVFSIGACA